MSRLKLVPGEYMGRLQGCIAVVHEDAEAFTLQIEMVGGFAITLEFPKDGHSLETKLWLGDHEYPFDPAHDFEEFRRFAEIATGNRSPEE